MQVQGIASPEGFSSFVHDHLGRTIGQLDVKVSLFLTVATTALVYVFQSFGLAREFSAAVHALNMGTLPVLPLSAWLALAASLALSGSFFCAIEALLPRFGPSGENIMFFRSIAAFESGPSYARAVAERCGNDLVNAVLADAHSLARIAHRKAFWTMWATRFVTVGLFALVMSEFIRSNH